MFKILKYLKKKDWFFICVGVLLIVTQVWLELKMPEYTKNLSSALATGEVDMRTMWQNGGPMIACALGSMVAAIICGFFVSEVAANFARTLREKIFDKITNFSNKEINQFSTPSLITRTTNDVVQMQMFVAMGLQLLIKAPVLAVWSICKISASNIKWTMAVAITIVAIVVMLSIIIGLCYPRFKRIQKLTDDLNRVTRENISGVRVIRAYNADDFQAKKFDKVNSDVTKNHLFTARTMGFLMPIMTMCMSGLSLAIYWIAAVLIKDTAGATMLQTIDMRKELIGDMMAFSQYALQVVGAFMMLIMTFVILPRTMVSAKRINEVLQTKPSIKFADADQPTDKVGELVFNNVTFSYSAGKEPCLSEVSFKINKGETFAIIGATGSGKTTLVNLITRFFDVSSGEILLDGINIKDYSKHGLEKKISIAPQKAALFKGDIKSNVSYGCEREVEYDDPKLLNALKIAKADFVFDNPQGLRAPVAQGGTNFSGGQKQRLSIARAIFKEAEITIFDDTFSALDYKTDYLVRKNIKQNLKNMTTIIVAQRIGTIKNADQILVLDKGKVVGLGKHKQLLKTCPVYREIALSQLSKEEL